MRRHSQFETSNLERDKAVDHLRVVVDATAEDSADTSRPSELAPARPVVQNLGAIAKQSHDRQSSHYDALASKILNQPQTD